MPSFEVLKKVSASQDWNPMSPFFIQRNHHKYGQEEIIHQIQLHFKLPYEMAQNVSEKAFDHFCYLSQCSQAVCVKAQTEHYRRLKTQTAHCMGALYWQCNDIWEVNP